MLIAVNKPFNVLCQFTDRDDPPVRFRKTVPDAWIELTISEGRNRQVRRMTAAVGLPTLRLIRTRISDIALGNLAPGETRIVGKTP